MDSSILINERIYSLVLDHTNSMYQSIYVDNTSLPIAKMVNDIQNPTSFTILYIDTTVPIGTSWNVTVYYGTNTEWSGVLMYGKDNTTINGQLNITDNEQTISSTIPQYVSIGGSDVDIVTNTGIDGSTTLYNAYGISSTTMYEGPIYPDSRVVLRPNLYIDGSAALTNLGVVAFQMSIVYLGMRKPSNGGNHVPTFFANVTNTYVYEHQT